MNSHLEVSFKSLAVRFDVPMLVYKGVACQVEDHFYIGIQCNILWIIKDPLIAGTDAVIFVHAFTMIHCISPEENWQCSVIRIIKDRKIPAVHGWNSHRHRLQNHR